MRKWFCDICGKETDGDLENYPNPISFITRMGTFDDKGIRIQIDPVESIDLQDVCLDCQRIIGLIIKTMKKVK